MEPAGFDLITALIGGGGTASAVLASYAWWVRKEAIKTADTLHKRVNAVIKDLAAYKLSASKEYASVGHLQEVEGNLVKQLETMNATLIKLVSAISTMQGALGVREES